jgi:preprotein translocase subunit YajC
MATYTIIGGDQKPYSSVTADDLRKWITDGRLNAQSLAKEENDTEWRPLSAFPEFADVLAASSAPPPPFSSPVAAASGGRDAALQLVKGPAIGLKVTAILGLVLVAAGLVMNIMTLGGFQIFPQQINDPQMQKLLSSLSGGLGIVQGIIGGVVGVIVLIGAAKMQKLQSYQFALTASIVAMVPCISPCCVFGLPFGIWALVVLNKPEVKSQFG